MNYQDYIKSELLILIPVLYFIGTGLKKRKITNKFIPLLLVLTSISLCLIWILATSRITCTKDIALAVFVAITQGVLLAGGSVYTNQLYIQSKKNE